MIDKPHAPACDRNRDPILAVLHDYFADRRGVLEIGSGTGQHAVYFAAALPELIWQCSDVEENLPGIRAWLADAALPNTPEPLLLDVRREWPQEHYDAVFMANTLHIMSWGEVEATFAGIAGVSENGAVLVIYGPFNYQGRYTSDSNAQFDKWLQASAPQMGIRDFEAVDTLAEAAGFRLVEDRAMPANNRMLVWRHAQE